MSPSELQTPEQMLERWQGVSCTCDPIVGHLCESCHDTQVLRDLISERDRMVYTLQRIALLADTGSDEHKKEFETYYANFDKPIGWRVAERMREIANDVAGNYPIEDMTIYKRAMESMAKQLIHPKMTGLQLAKMQLE
jgi:hypothetical protein